GCVMGRFLGTAVRPGGRLGAGPETVVRRASRATAGEGLLVERNLPGIVDPLPPPRKPKPLRRPGGNRLPSARGSTRPPGGPGGAGGGPPRFASPPERVLRPLPHEAVGRRGVEAEARVALHPQPQLPVELDGPAAQRLARVDRRHHTPG